MTAAARAFNVARGPPWGSSLGAAWPTGCLSLLPNVLSRPRVPLPRLSRGQGLTTAIPCFAAASSMPASYVTKVAPNACAAAR